MDPPLQAATGSSANDHVKPWQQQQRERSSPHLQRVMKAKGMIGHRNDTPPPHMRGPPMVPTVVPTEVDVEDEAVDTTTTTPAAAAAATATAAIVAAEAALARPR